ncbi:cytochrome oxidase assembly protein-domain-containing protein [Pseudoneurospora amorphoporcata]|uniref:Cytochrome oxidase assembly protein-domain-containing protein n=1 Tax=Pseudoneurospora amorphoporcata TaxID=241081 RepID=A0AAN6P6S1_9PEZI|nr:cytochrome oxidase assembly protein-domain-containing protein [Pseudoneurospora amorphoporcata]
MAFVFQLGLRRAAVQLSRPSVFCTRACALNVSQPQLATPPASSIMLKLVSQARHTQSRNYATQKVQESPLSKLAADIAKPVPSSSDKSSENKSSFPETSSKSVAYWLLASAASVFGIVVFGGLTRLTESGLSITEWRPVTGSLWPGSPEEWESEFEKYRASPEFKMLNSTMTLHEFKQIYFMEWTHRLWGRFIGMSFVLPTIYFIARRRVTPRMACTLVGISALIGFQGFIGWWMVKSGLKDDLFAPGSHPRVSQYRLAAHLSTAFVCYSWMLLAGLSILRTHKAIKFPEQAVKNFTALQSPALRVLRGSVAALTVLIFTTVLSGAFVAGLDAGLIYNDLTTVSWPCPPSLLFALWLPTAALPRSRPSFPPLPRRESPASSISFLCRLLSVSAPSSTWFPFPWLLPTRLVLLPC